tara:strand:+ start:356 stop:766 length:411 start_codon:yes stop_codon:yes gene_type:complete
MDEQLATADDFDLIIDEQQKEKSAIKFFSFTLATSIVFWLWAMLNTFIVDKGFDLGIVSFLTVIFSSSLFLGKCCSSHTLNFTTHLFVAINYGLGAVFGFQSANKRNFTVYCTICCMGWLLSAFKARKLLAKSSSS